MILKASRYWILIFLAIFVQPTFLISEEIQLKSSSELKTLAAPKPTSTNKDLQRFKVGQKAPFIEGFTCAGSVSNLESNKGSFILLTYWKLNDKNYEQNLRAIERIFKKYQDRDDFKIVSFWIEDWTEYLAEMKKRGSSFYSSRNWWKLKFVFSGLTKKTDRKINRIWENDFSEDKTPVYILLDKELKFLAIDIPNNKLEETLDSYLKPPANKAE